jgi:hypothetical protein
MRITLTAIGLFIVLGGSASAATLNSLLVSPTALDFGDVPVGSHTATQRITMTNVSSAVLTTAISVNTDGQFLGTLTCPTTLAPGQACTLDYAFAPAALGSVTGTATGTIGGQAFTITLTGNGTRHFLISPTSLDFGNVAMGRTSGQQIVTITNLSNQPTVMNGTGNPTGAFGLIQTCQGATLNPGATCQMIFMFSPQKAGTASVTATGSWNGQPFTFALTGNGYQAATGDFDGDGKADLTVWRPSTGEWWILKSIYNFTIDQVPILGASTDRPVPGDYDGDGRVDPAVFRPSTGVWTVATSSSNYATTITKQWGDSTDIPVPRDYDGDGKTDFAVFRPSDGTWYIVKSSTNTPIAVQWGNSTDVPVPGDYDGDGKADIAIFRPSDGTWYILLSSTGTPMNVQWGNSTDVTVPGDYDGDGKTDLAIFRPADSTWYILKSSTGTAMIVQWGTSTDVMVPADYDGDGKTDLAVYRPSSGTWFILNSSTGVPTVMSWGVSTDIPIPETYLGRWNP